MKNSNKVRKSFSDDFKARIGLEALKEQRTILEIAQENNITTKLVYNWRSMVEKNIVNVFKKQSKLAKLIDNKDQEIRSLQQQIVQLVTETMWLKKTLDR